MKPQDVTGNLELVQAPARGCPERHPDIRSHHSKAKATIDSLPFEILSAIFDIVHQDWLMYALHPELYTMQPVELRSRSWKGLMKLLYQFPYIPAAVCHYWRSIIASTPKYWTRSVIFVDTKDPLSSLSNLLTLLKHSRNLPVSVAVVRKSYNIMYDKEEGINVYLYMDVLLRNLHRIQDLYFHVNQSSSLPSIIKFIQRHRPVSLARLALHCDIDDGDNTDDTFRLSVSSIKGTRSALTNLKIDGRNFMTIARNPTMWALTLSRLTSLTLERVQYSDRPRRNIPFNAAIEFISKLPRLEVLTIRDVLFEVSPVVQGSPLSEITISDLILEDLGDGVLKTIFDRVLFKPSYMLLRNVLIDELPRIPQPNYLELCEIPIDQDLEDFLCFWDGEVLAVRSCLGFDDNLLALFQAEISPPFHVMLSPSLRELHIQDCTEFSSKALRSMVQARKGFTERPDNADLTGLACITDVYVCGLGPVLEPEDAVWLRKNLKTFVWSTIQANGGSCHLEHHSSVPLMT